MIQKGIAICEEKMILKFENFLEKYKLVQKTEEVKIEVDVTLHVDQTNNEEDVLSTSYLSPDDICLTKSEPQHHQNSTYSLPVINFCENSPNT